ncbi:aminopeptidase N [Anopheles ziemanni]|uniref:aminopeptidase N n=1 Tax=Anopheles coustani TaxID=139045 RepID=UPI00265A8CE8|nr:aminopeptidase N [Anopheles coustani]XP_058127861.1 aminopeptidase N [Anopheles coustani]XP_058127862.1 aminopeptidase N [Anopheles coustani]XP_058176641.1 aminopeptidase N [Anopheles ziemanni]
MGRHILSLLIAVLAVTLLPCGYTWREYRIRRSIDLSAANTLISDAKLPTDLMPVNYSLYLHPVLEQSSFTGRVNVTMLCTKRTNRITLHAHHDLQVDEVALEVVNTQDATQPLKIRRVDRVPKKPLLVIFLQADLTVGETYEARLQFAGNIWENTEGVFEGKYKQQADGAAAVTSDVALTVDAEEHSYIGTYCRPHHARRVFPCFDEPAYKVPFAVSIARPRTHHVLFNTELERTESLGPSSKIVIDVFKPTPPMSTFTFGFLLSDLQEVTATADAEDPDFRPKVRVWSRRDFQQSLTEVRKRVRLTLEKLQEYWGVELPLEKLDIVALPGFSYVKPADNWGLIVFKESELQQGYYSLAQELVYQWLGSWITPHWWSDAHVNKAIAGFLSADTAIKIDGGAEFEGKWPMTILYSIYYEFSKRYPHSRITAMKQETTCSKTELVLRMLNYTLGEETFRRGLQKFIRHREFKTFYGDDVWEALTKQAHLDQRLCESATVNDVVNSWITKDRIPMVKVERSYGGQRTATVTQRLYLRERPHDVPEQDKMLWWIPLVVVTQDRLDFSNTSATKWMKQVREVVLEDLPADDRFIIVNPEEIGPFPVNYDEQNWNLLASFLQTDEGRARIPVYTRAKLLHDAWNLAYAGDLSFGTAFNMTLFMKFERNHLVWNPVFTLIDHIGRHIDMSAVHKKFETYVRTLLTPLYEELVGSQQESEETWKANLRSLAKNFLCRAGYKPCIEEAQRAFKKWMDSPEPDLGNPVANQYICPVFKWGTREEWEFGLQRVINFPESRVKSERTYLLKTLAGCPSQPSKIDRLLNITVLEDNGNFTDNDVGLIFKMLSGGSSGYSTLFNFLKNNWDTIKLRFKDRESLWDNMINSATGLFTTQEGYDMVSQLYVQHQGEFGTAEHIIEKSLKNIKEETKWSDENLPVIEQWLDSFLASNSATSQKFFG